MAPYIFNALLANANTISYTLEGNNTETINGGSETYKITVGGREATIKGAVINTFQDKWTQNVSKKVDQTYQAGKQEKVTSGGVTETYTGNHKKDVAGEVLHTSTGKWHASGSTNTFYGQKLDVGGLKMDFRVGEIKGGLF